MTVAYDGSGFHGFAAQPGQRTVAGEMAAAIAKVVGHPVEISCAGRTDAGVHAWGQVVHTDVSVAGLCRHEERAQQRMAAPGGSVPAVGPGGAGPGGAGPGGVGPAEPSGFDCTEGVERLRTSCNRMLAPAVVVRDAEIAPEGFDARRSAVSRSYRYTVLNSKVPDPFSAAFAWHVDKPLDLGSMQAAADPLIGEHDFAAFCRKAEGASTIRRVLDARWRRVEAPSPAEGGQVLRFEIEASSFCHQMVRSLVGTMVEMGGGRISPGDMSYILASGDRSLAGSPAPAHGLCLWSVGYPDLQPGGAASPDRWTQGRPISRQGLG